MPQVFSPSGVLGAKLVLLALVLLAVVVAFAARWRMSGPLDVDAMPAQPIPFSHKHHAGDDGIDCRYCHTSVEKSAFAGMPSTATCLTCHSQLYRDAAMLAPLHESARTGVAVAWTRVHDLPDFVYFDHSIHVGEGVDCVECHGRVDQMPLMRRVAPLTMQWCLDCHRNPAPHLREASRAVHLQSTQRLTDCSTCHR